MVARSHGRGDINLPTECGWNGEFSIAQRALSHPQWSCPTVVKVGYGPLAAKMVIFTVNLLLSAL